MAITSKRKIPISRENQITIWHYEHYFIAMVKGTMCDIKCSFDAVWFLVSYFRNLNVQMVSGDSQFHFVSFRLNWVLFDFFFRRLAIFLSLPYCVSWWLEKCLPHFYLSKWHCYQICFPSAIYHYILIEANAFPILNFRVFWSPYWCLTPFDSSRFPRVNMMFTKSCIIKIEIGGSSVGGGWYTVM